MIVDFWTGGEIGSSGLKMGRVFSLLTFNLRLRESLNELQRCIGAEAVSFLNRDYTEESRKAKVEWSDWESDIEGKAAREAASECGQRASFKVELNPSQA